MFHVYTSGLKRTFDFKGRSSRKEYWGFVGINFIIIYLFCLLAAICGINNINNDIAEVIVMVFMFFTLISNVALAVRRVHDRNLAWYYLLIPCYNIVLMFLPGNKGSNRFGSDPYAGSQRNNTNTFQPNHEETGNTYNGYQNNNTGAAEKRFCSYCGSSINPSATFCSKCGKMVQQTVHSNAGEESRMNSPKVVQVLKDIFSKYGVDIIREQQRFKFAVLDFLSGQEYKEEKIIFRNAIESDALLPFAVPSSVTDETTKAVLLELQQKGHLTEKDARFVVQCMLTACGSNVNIR